jgi:sulfatase modifying factor 1
MLKSVATPHPLVTGHPPAWASEWGEDPFGVFVAFRVGEVSQRLRWIPPGRFWMGSPEHEEGRYEDEGPRHLVELTSGFWLADTPCTQELYEAVMGDNPSRFRTPRRPVEQVSWEDCQLFFQRLEEHIPGLDARLPTEAEWEHACRAGTETATWRGELRIEGANNAPLLDEIAWYGGNSGEGYDLEEFQDSSGWPEKQYQHQEAGSRDVALKKPNPWGLYDMLGNVDEWCLDWQRNYVAGRVVDPQGPETGTHRVIRGGSWYSSAQNVRAACRSWNPPGNRYSNLGFRLARGQGRGAPDAEPGS